MEAQLQVIAKDNAASCASYALPTNHHVAWWDDDNACATISIMDLTSTGDGHCVDSSNDE
jgi:hypothetical protein